MYVLNHSQFQDFFFYFPTSKGILVNFASITEFIVSLLKQLYSRVQPQVTVHIQKLCLYPGVDSLCHKQLFELITSLFFPERRLSL